MLLHANQILVEGGLLIIVASWKMDKALFDALLHSEYCQEHFSLKKRAKKMALEGMVLQKCSKTR
jgi:hypothetical protein